MRRITLVVWVLSVIFLFTDNYSSAATEKISIGIVSSEASDYG